MVGFGSETKMVSSRTSKTVPPKRVTVRYDNGAQTGSASGRAWRSEPTDQNWSWEVVVNASLVSHVCGKFGIQTRANSFYSLTFIVLCGLDMFRSRES